MKGRPKPARSPVPTQRTLGLLALGLLLLLAGRASASGLPEIQAEVRVTSEIFRDGLGADLPAVQEEVARQMAAEAGEYFSYLRWTGKPAGGAPDHGLIAVLEDRDSEGCGRDVYLVFRGRLGGREARLNLLPEIPFDSLCNFDIADGDPDRFGKQLLTAIKGQLSRESFREALSEQLLHEISLAAELHVAEQSVGLPFSLADIRSSEKSLLTVKIPSRDDPNVQAAVMTVRTSLGWGSRIRCRIEEFSSTLGNLTTPVTTDPAIEEVLRPDRFGRVGIYMQHYEQSLGAGADPFGDDPFGGPGGDDE